MKKLLSQKLSRKEAEAKTPLVDTSAEDAPNRHIATLDNVLVQNSINSKNEDFRGPQTRKQTSPLSKPQALDQNSLCELLGISPDFVSVYAHGSAHGSVDLTETLIQESVRAHLPQPPLILNKNLQRHLLELQSVVQKELLRLAPLLELKGLMGVLTQSYLCAVFRQMKELLLQISSSETCLQLLHWVLTQCLSQELFLHPDLQALDLGQCLDLVLLSDWIQDAQNKLLPLLQTELSSWLQHILDAEREHQPCLTEEAYVCTYVDLIKCINAAPSEARKFNRGLSLKLLRVCLDELLTFTHGYKTQWFEWLERQRKRKMAHQEMTQFFRMLKICKELKEYLTQTKLQWTEVMDLTMDIEVLLEETEAFTVTVLLDTVAAFTESGLKIHFKSTKTNSSLMTDLERLFTPQPWMKLDEHKSTLDRCYRLIVSLYSKNLTSHRLRKLEQTWSRDVGIAVLEDAGLLHRVMTSLNPEVEDWKFPLQFISDLLETKDLNAVKLLSCTFLHNCTGNRLTDDMSLLPALLQWKGMSKLKIKEVLDSLKDEEHDLVLPRACCFCCFG